MLLVSLEFGIFKTFIVIVVKGDMPEVAMVSLVDSGVSGTFDVEANEAIPYDQGSAVIKNLSNVDMTLISSNHFQESELNCLTTDDLFTQESQHMISTLSTSNEVSSLQEQSTMMDYKEEPSCSSDAVITTEDEETARITKEVYVLSSVFDEMISDVQDEEDDDTGEFGVWEI